MRAPSIRTLSQYWEYPVCKRIRHAIRLCDPTKEDTQTWSVASTLRHLNSVISGYGVEHIEAGHNQRSPEMDYVGFVVAVLLLYVVGIAAATYHYFGKD